MITYEIDRTAQLVTCQVTTGLRILDVGNFIEVLFADAAFDGNFNTLVLVDDATVAPDIVARNGLAHLMLSWRKMHARTKWALVLPGSAWRRLADQLIEQYGLGTRNVRCVPDRVAALAWFAELSPAA